MKASIIEIIHLKLDMQEANQLCAAINRVTKNTDKETPEKFTEQDKMIFIKTSNALENACKDI